MRKPQTLFVGETWQMSIFSKFWVFDQIFWSFGAGNHCWYVWTQKNIANRIMTPCDQSKKWSLLGRDYWKCWSTAEVFRPPAGSPNFRPGRRPGGRLLRRRPSGRRLVLSAGRSAVFSPAGRPVICQAGRTCEKPAGRPNLWKAGRPA